MNQTYNSPETTIWSRNSSTNPSWQLAQVRSGYSFGLRAIYDVRIIFEMTAIQYNVSFHVHSKIWFDCFNSFELCWLRATQQSMTSLSTRVIARLLIFVHLRRICVNTWMIRTLTSPGREVIRPKAQQIQRDLPSIIHSELLMVKRIQIVWKKMSHLPNKSIDSCRLFYVYWRSYPNWIT